GAGGLSEGFKKAGFNPIAHVEKDQAACFTLKTRVAYYYLIRTGKKHIYYSYLKGEISREKLYSYIPEKELSSVINSSIGGKNNKSIFGKIDTLKANQSVDLIVGGPPCQAYSYIGRAALNSRVKNDERNFLYKEYGKFLKRYRPKIFVFENVPGIKTAGKGKHFKNLKKYFRRIGYNLDSASVNSFDFGVIQNRERLIIIGWRKDIDFSYPKFKKINHSWTRDDIFSDLPPLKPNQNDRYLKYARPINEYLSKTGIRNCVDFVSQHITRPHNKKDLSIYKLAVEKLDIEGKLLKNNEIPTDKRTQKNTTDFLDRFKVVGKKPHTIIAHLSKDGHHFIYPSTEQLRSISVREAARIQSFPDDYFFEGVKPEKVRTPAFRQIGNAVPPLMSKAIAKKIKLILEN
ncbi:MAG TPA: DNA (cytosine-5-)-methyltransferase, partial [Chryseobacterium sp.]|nr:DNA (cytosine-5-)-methyltransferase [Chryseobacterium sp.]